MRACIGTHRLFVLIIAGATAAGCSEAPADGAAPAGTQASGGRGNACQLLDKEDMERLHGAGVTLLHNIEADDRTTCEVYDAQTNQAFFSLEVLWKNGAGVAKTEGTARGIAAGTLADRSVDVGPLTAAGPKAADSVYYSAVAASWVLKGDVLLRFTMAGLTQEQRMQNFVPLARKALDRLP
jgi:hypothetical protein